MRLNKLVIWFVGALLNCKFVFSLNILAVLPYQGKSHFFVFKPYLEELAKRGHNLTVISYFPQQERTENYTDISLAGKLKAFEGSIPVHRSYLSTLKMISFVFEMGRKNCEVMLAEEKVQNLWQSKANFDLMVTEQFHSDCALGLAYKLGTPVVGLTSHTLMPWQYENLGLPYNPSYIPYLFLEGDSKPTLYQRIERTIFHYFINLYYKYRCLRVNQNQLQQYFDVPPLEDLVRDTKFVLLYTNFVLNGPQMLPPNIVEVGGYHVAKPKTLPEELKKFIEESKHGVIFISFGSMLQPKSLPHDKLKIMIEVLSELPQRVIWKWDDKELPGNPKNIFVSKWLPQNDILGHPNVRAFYSHCGTLSSTEAIHHAVPIICTPVMGDQALNSAAVEENGLGVQIQLRDITKELLLHKMKTILDPEFRRKVKELSNIWHDRPVSAMDAAIHWTEFAARTKNFTFRPLVSTVPLYQYLHLDILAVTIMIMLGIIFIIKMALSLMKTTAQQKSRKIKNK